jgi:hypothetical protein
MRSGAALRAVWLDAFLRRLAHHSSWGIAATAIEFALGLAETTLVAELWAWPIRGQARAGPGGAQARPAAVGLFRVILVGMGLAVATFWGTPAALGSGRPGMATSAVASGVLVNVGLLLLLISNAHFGTQRPTLPKAAGSFPFDMLTTPTPPTAPGSRTARGLAPPVVSSAETGDAGRPSLFDTYVIRSGGTSV